MVPAKQITCFIFQVCEIFIYSIKRSFIWVRIDGVDLRDAGVTNLDVVNERVIIAFIVVYMATDIRLRIIV